MAKKFNIRKTQIFHNYYGRLKNIALSVFKWENLPDTCNERFLEETLFHYGMAVFVNDPTMGFLNLKVTPASTLNVYNEPTAYTAYSIGYNQIYQAEECVPVWNNYTKRPTEESIILFAERLATIELMLGVNINAQKTPILIKADEKSKKSLEVLYDQYEGDKPFIFGTKALEDKPLEAIVTGAPYIADKLREEKRAIWNEALEFLGINTNPSDKKKERLIISEVQSNNEQIDIQTLTMLLCRQQTCDKFNKLYKKDIKVSMRVDELKDLWDYGVNLTGEAPQREISEVLNRG